MCVYKVSWGYRVSSIECGPKKCSLSKVVFRVGRGCICKIQDTRYNWFAACVTIGILEKVLQLLRPQALQVTTTNNAAAIQQIQIHFTDTDTDTAKAADTACNYRALTTQ